MRANILADCIVEIGFVSVNTELFNEDGSVSEIRDCGIRMSSFNVRRA